MRSFVVAALTLSMLFALSACASRSRSSGVRPIENLSDVDSLSVLIHFEKSGVPVSREMLEHDVLDALERAGVRVSHAGPPYLHVRVYCRCGEQTVSDQDTTLSHPASWHFGMWVDQSVEYSMVWGPLPNICPSGPLVWSRGGSGLVTDGTLVDFIEMSLSEFVDEYRATDPDR